MTAIKSTSTSEPNPQIRETCREQYLFLLEFYVRCIQSPRLTKLNEMFYVPTTVAFRFLDFETDDELQLTPVNTQFQPQAGIADDIEPFYAGRSVLFALAQSAVSDVYRDFKIDVSVFKRMPKEIKPDVLVGKAEVDLSVHFAALRKEVIDSVKYPEAAVPNPSKIFDDEIPLFFDDYPCGTLGIFARISAHGQTIITEFSAPREGISSAASFLFKANDAECDNRPLSYKCRVLEPDTCTLSSILSEDGAARRNDCFVCKPPKMACSPCRVASGAKIASKDVCQKKPETQCVLESCTPGIQTSRGPKEPCGKAVVLKVSGLLDACADGKPQQPCVTVAPESEATNPADMYDPEHDVFILRIGKKGLVGAGEKSDIQLEMRTPKGPERRPPVRLETREIQTEEETKKAGKKGGKGKKKKK